MLIKEGYGLESFSVLDVLWSVILCILQRLPCLYFHDILFVSSN